MSKRQIKKINFTENDKGKFVAKKGSKKRGEIVYITKDHLIIEIDGKEEIVRSDELIFFNPLQLNNNYFFRSKGPEVDYPNGVFTVTGIRNDKFQLNEGSHWFDITDFKSIYEWPNQLVYGTHIS